MNFKPQNSNLKFQISNFKSPSLQSPASSLRPFLGRTRLRVIAGLLILGIASWLLIERHFGNVEYFVITSESMEPTLKIGDRVLMEKKKNYGVGEIVVLNEPGKPAERLVKRIVAAEGDVVSAIEDDLVVTRPPQKPPAKARRSWTIKPDEVFVAGDNRPISRDSRDFGPVPLDAIHGKVARRRDSLLHWTAVE